MTRAIATTPRTERSAVLSDDTRALLRTVGAVALRLADSGIDDPAWLRAQIGGLPDGLATASAQSTLLTVPEACERLRLSRWSIYQLIHRRELGTVKIGRRRFVPVSEVQRLVNELTVVGGRA
ncbi:helix-turn-helix domain-containing protein [Nocardia sp. BSTN01]|uniref:helix-turn-helix domain-containing protein n=1 Tax=Nocardia sp. BSTN01 TaxID=2783665 RepID=UPI00188F389C|nr:helix-turn-helix domain-containing protein [Nocardia sp. BSTN01]MBF4996698.1 helix-turn-helix domain-containing protein [Nocardia sp. BSTN01]